VQVAPLSVILPRTSSLFNRLRGGASLLQTRRPILLQKRQSDLGVPGGQIALLGMQRGTEGPGALAHLHGSSEQPQHSRRGMAGPVPLHDPPGAFPSPGRWSPRGRPWPVLAVPPPWSPPVSMSYYLFPMAGFQVTLHGRFWVTAEAYRIYLKKRSLGFQVTNASVRMRR